MITLDKYLAFPASMFSRRMKWSAVFANGTALADLTSSTVSTHLRVSLTVSYPYWHRWKTKVLHFLRILLLRNSSL